MNVLNIIAGILLLFLITGLLLGPYAIMKYIDVLDEKNTITYIY